MGCKQVQYSGHGLNTGKVFRHFQSHDKFELLNSGIVKVRYSDVTIFEYPCNGRMVLIVPLVCLVRLPLECG